MYYLPLKVAVMHKRGFYKATLVPEAAVLECLRKKINTLSRFASHVWLRCTAIISHRETTSKAWPLLWQFPHPPLLHQDHRASPFTFSWNDLISTFLLASAFIHIWGSQWSSFNNSTRMGPLYDVVFSRSRLSSYPNIHFFHLQLDRWRATNLLIYV